MSISEYKYDPKDFEGIPSMSDDLMAFYRALEAYKSEKNSSNGFDLQDKIENIELSIKHCTLNGDLNTSFANELNDYIRGLLKDD